MARHSGPALQAVAWLTLSLMGLGLTLLASVRAFDRTTLVPNPSPQPSAEDTAQAPVHAQPPVHGTSSGIQRTFFEENTANSSRKKCCRLGPGDLLLLVSEDFSGNDHLFSLQAVLSGAGGAGEVAADTAASGSFCEPEWSSGRSAAGAVAGAVAGDIAASCVGAADSERLSSSAEGLPSRRLFQLPRLSFERPVAVMTECELAGSAGGAGIYSEAGAGESAAIVRSRVSDFLSGGLLAAVEEWLGPILDVDGSGGLTVVVGQLDPARESAEYPLWGCVRESDFGVGESGPAGDILYLDAGVAEISEQDFRALLVHELSHAACFSRLLERRLAGSGELSVPRWFHESLAHLVESALAGERGLLQRRREACWRDPGAAPVVVNLQRMTWAASRRGPRAAGYRFLLASGGVERMRGGQLSCLLRESAGFEELLGQFLGGAREDALRGWAVAEAQAMGAAGLQWIPELSAAGVTEQRVLGTAFAVWRAGTEPLDVAVESGDDSDWTLTVIRR